LRAGREEFLVRDADGGNRSHDRAFHPASLESSSGEPGYRLLDILTENP
jgi:hypothetical protein